MSLDNLQAWSQSITEYWTDKNIRLAAGISSAVILEAENILGFQFPNSFKALYNKANGFSNNDWTENMISIWSIDRILDEYGRYPGFIGFSDFLLNNHVYGFLKGQDGIFKNYDIKEPILPERIANTFEEAFNLINTDSDLLY